MSGNGDKTALICPLMSGQLVMTEAQPGGVLTPGKPVLTPTKVVCAREACEWWDNVNACCSQQQLSATMVVLAQYVLEMKAALEPLRLLTGSLRRLCDKLNDLILAVDWKKGN